MMNEGYLIDVSDRTFWDTVHVSPAQGDEGYNAALTGRGDGGRENDGRFTASAEQRCSADPATETEHAMAN